MFVYCLKVQKWDPSNYPQRTVGKDENMMRKCGVKEKDTTGKEGKEGLSKSVEGNQWDEREGDSLGKAW